MKLRLQWRIALSFILIFLIFAVLLLLLLPGMVSRAYQKAALQGTPPNLIPSYLMALVLAVLAGILFLLTIFKLADRHTQLLSVLTSAAKGLGEGRFQEIEIPDEEEVLVEVQGLSQALHQTASQIETQIKDLSRERAMLSAILSQMTDGVLIADSDGRVQLLNRTAEKLFHMTNNAALGRSVVEVMRHHALVELWEGSQEGEPKAITIEMGVEHKFLQVVGIPLGEALPGRTMLLFQDLTQTHRLETVRRDFISNISHELRTPMAGLKALSETLLDGALEDPPIARKFVLRMDAEVDNLTQMVNELLELSRIEAGRTNFEFQRSEPCKLIAKPVERMALQVERVGLKLHVNCPEGLPLIFADPQRISQVLINLLHNAIKFTPPGGEIQVGAWVHDQDVIFMVRDNGVGISEKDQKRIFERFYKADRARAGGGTGLGLSICRHMIEAHSGEIWVESEEGKGSSFFFRIPIAPPQV